jgi:hypothetical protein
MRFGAAHVIGRHFETLDPHGGIDRALTDFLGCLFRFNDGGPLWMSWRLWSFGVEL